MGFRSCGSRSVGYYRSPTGSCPVHRTRAQQARGTVLLWKAASPWSTVVPVAHCLSTGCSWRVTKGTMEQDDPAWHPVQQRVLAAGGPGLRARAYEAAFSAGGNLPSRMLARSRGCVNWGPGRKGSLTNSAQLTL